MIVKVLYSPIEIQQYSTNLFGRVGCPRSLTIHAELGMFLLFIGSTMNTKHLRMLFGTTPNVCSQAIRGMLKWVPLILRNNEFVNVAFPNYKRMTQFAAMVQIRELVAHDVIGFLDGVSLHSECSSDTLEQNAMYNGYHSDTIVNNLIVYGADGKVILCALNFPGSSHDGSLYTNILPILRERIGVFKICIDQVFTWQGDTLDILVGPVSKRSERSLSPFLRDYVLRL